MTHKRKSYMAREIIDRFGIMPNGQPTPSKKLGRILYKEYNLDFPTEAAAYTAIRYARGASGEAHRKNIGDSKYIPDRELVRNPYNLPKSDEVSWEPFMLTGRKILVLSDIHIPYHNVDAVTAALNYAKELKPDTILLNGDTIDCHMLSNYVKDPKKRNFAGELEVFAHFMSALKKAFPRTKIIFKEGNHEERYNNFLMRKANELSGVDEFSLEAIIRKRAPGIEYVGEKRIIKAGYLNIIHGHEFGKGFFSPVNVARGLFLRGKVSAMQGHNHQTSEHTESDMNGEIVTTFSLGCLSELHPAYLPINKWNHGFAFVKVAKDGSFEVHNKRIRKGKVL